MPTIWFQTPDLPHRQHVTASSLTAALLDLRAAGLKLSAAGTDDPVRVRATVRWGRLIPVYEQLSNLLAKGMPLVEALDLLARRTGHRRLRISLERLAGDIRNGRTLSEAMAAQPGVYSQFALSMVEAGEAAGDVPVVLADLAAQQRDLQATTRRLIPLVIYPLIVLGIVFLDLTFLMTFIFPKFLQLFKELGMTDDHFPTVTLVLMRAQEHLWPCFGVLLTIVILLYVVRSFQVDLTRGYLAFERARLQLPFFGGLALNLALSNAALALSLLLRRNVETAQAMRLAGAASGNGVLEALFRQAASEIREGRSLVDALAARHFLPEELVTQVGAAEAAADLPDALARLSEDYRQRVNQSATLYPYIVGPVLIILLGLLLMFIAFGTFAPLVSIIGELSS